MTSLPLRRPGRPTSAREAAAAWVLQQEERELDEHEQQRFAAWLAEDETHIGAYDDALWALDAVGRHAGELELRELRAAALGARANRRGRLWAWSVGSGLVAAALAGFTAWTLAPGAVQRVGEATRIAERTVDPRDAIYTTSVGERSALRLPDGSVATLDTDSRLRVAYTARERGLHLLKGQALFEVAHDQPLPFQVYARGQRITALGTTFNVRIEGDEVRVSMVEGKVRVRSEPSRAEAQRPAKELVLVAGESLSAQSARPMVIRPVPAEQVASWKGGLLVFHDTSLTEAVAEVNRYTTRPIAVADAAAGYRVSGVFKSNDPEHFAQAMAEVFPLEVTHSPGGAVTLRARGD
jgi:transmembrane sensor